ncbi:hypothetical protein ACFFX0_10285 [Citricoccus parietis]|uniref:Uncharacterized protein n=1 Tax=Citricoccus parietis TaxID=592307 RepID=A0ABV5FYS7_9MICC
MTPDTARGAATSARRTARACPWSPHCGPRGSGLAATAPGAPRAPPDGWFRPR